MSLHNAAKHLTAQGRGPDDHLVHMSGKEVAGLQALAMAHGGSLTINPKTGLPEAGFLDDILPTLAIGAGIYAAMYGVPDFSSMTMPSVSGALSSAGAQAPVLDAVATLPGAAYTAPEAFTLSGNVLQPTIGSVANGTGAAEVMAANAGGAGASSLMSGMGKYALPVAGGLAASYLLNSKKADPGNKTTPMIRPHTYNYNPQRPDNMIGSTYQPGQDTSERRWFDPYYTAGTPYAAADGGIIALADGGMPVEQMSNQAAVGANTMYPMANMTTSAFATPYQTPQSTNMMASMAPSGGGTVNMMSGEPNMQGTRLAEGGIAKYGFGGFLGDAVSDIGSHLGHMFKGGDDAGWQKVMEMTADANNQQAKNAQNPQQTQMAMGGIANLGGYSDGGRLLRGPGDGVSDSIPAQIGDKQPARLADGEFVVPARIVSELGNGSTEAGAKQLYKMLDRVQNARAKTTGKEKVAKNTNAAKLLPA